VLQVDLEENSCYFQRLLEESIRIGMSSPKLEPLMRSLLEHYEIEKEPEVIFTSVSACMQCESNSVRQFAIDWLKGRIATCVEIGSSSIIPEDATGLVQGLLYAASHSSGNALSEITTLIEQIAGCQPEPSTHIIQLILLLVSDNLVGYPHHIAVKILKEWKVCLLRNYTILSFCACCRINI